MHIFMHAQLPWREAPFCCVSADETEEDMAEEVEWEDDGSLPLDKEGGLPFYFLDAHEEPHVPHTVYLFGKVGTLLLSEVSEIFLHSPQAQKGPVVLCNKPRTLC